MASQNIFATERFSSLVDQEKDSIFSPPLSDIGFPTSALSFEGLRDVYDLMLYKLSGLFYPPEMPRKARLDAPGAVQHIIIRGIERRKIFRNDFDRADLIKRLGRLLSETRTECFAWALIPNHAHFLLRTGLLSIAAVMRRMLTGYAVSFNNRYRRHGKLFQSRYKSILCQEDLYLKELVRYIHLNPLRAGLADDLKALDRYPWCGHSVLMGKIVRKWQNDTDVLALFGGSNKSEARRHYRKYVEKGIALGKRPELTGGGLIRSLGGWDQAKALRKTGTRLKSDERILGESGFVERVLSAANEQLDATVNCAREGSHSRCWWGMLRDG